MNSNLLFLFLVFLFSCTAPSLSQEELFRKERDSRIGQAIKNFIKTTPEKDMYAVGIGEGIDHSTGKQNYLKVVFHIDDLPDVDCARKLIVETIQTFLNAINAVEGIQDYLAEYPFPIRFVEISIVTSFESTGLFSVSNFRDKLIYDKIDPNNPMGPSIDIHTESYAEAVAILSQQEN